MNTNNPLVVIAAESDLNEENLETYQKKFANQYKSGVILLPVGFHVEAISGDVLCDAELEIDE